MDIKTRVIGALKALAGESIYANSDPQGLSIDAPQVERAREALGGQLQIRTASRLQWYIADLDTAQYMADSGQMSLIGQLSRACKRDGLIAGLRKTRSAGLVALPKRFYGRDDIRNELARMNSTRSLFDEMYPPDALAMFLDDLIFCGVAVAELLPVKGRTHPMMVRRDPEFLMYRWQEDRWYYNSAVGLLPITPGDGRWLLATGDRTSPWNAGCWAALGRPYIVKEHAILARNNFARKLANPAIVGYSPPAAREADNGSWLDQLVAWGFNTVFQVAPGWDLKILETNGRGWEVFGEEIEASNLDIMLTLAGSKVMVDGGTGFANAGIHAAIRADMIKENAEMLAQCINSQGLPHWVVANYGIEALSETARVDWNVSPALDVKAEAEGLKSVGEAIKSLREAIGDTRTLAIEEFINRFGIISKEGADKSLNSSQSNESDSGSVSKVQSPGDRPKGTSD